MPHIFPKLKIKDIFDHDPYKREPRPQRAWAVIFTAGVLSVIIILMFHIYRYRYMRSDDSFKFARQAEVNVIKINRKGLTDATAILETKKTQFQTLLGSLPNIPDPSFGVGQQMSLQQADSSTTPSQKPEAQSLGKAVSITVE